MSAAAVSRLSVDEYFALDDRDGRRYEYHDGELFRLEAVSIAHGKILISLGWRISERLQGAGYMVVASPHVQVSATQFLLPDVAIACEKETERRKYGAIGNPRVVIEILSPHTGDFDSGSKFRLYKSLPSLLEYVLIAQDVPRVEVFRRMPGSEWLEVTYDDLASAVKLESLRIEIPMAQIYADVEFSTGETP